jgi:hypothetical protein
MDTDPGTSLSIFIVSPFTISKTILDTVVKAQEAPANAKPSVSAPVSTAGNKKSSDKGKSVPEQGESRSHSLLFYCLASAFAVALAKVLSKMELDKIERARQVIADPTMEDIIQEHSQGPNEFENAVRFHIISFTQRINVSLSILDKLMELFNSSRESATAD